MVTTYIQQTSNGNFALDIVLPPENVLTSDTGERFQVKSPVQITLQFKEPTFVYRTAATGAAYQSAYQYDYLAASTTACPSDTLCCASMPNNRFKSFVRDAVTYAAYSLPPSPMFQYTVVVTASQGVLNKTIVLDAQHSIVSDVQSGS